MKISIIGSTKPGYVASKEEFETFSGHNADICYMASNFEKIENEDPQKTHNRANQTKVSGHHSVFDHPVINFYLEDIPKALAMVINNEHQYTTSEKSARYTKMVLKEDEQQLYDKWLEIFTKLITEKYQAKNPEFYTDKKIKKLAQENARYLISIFTPTSMAYSVTYRQLNNIYHMMQREINRPDSEQNKLYRMLKPAMIDFCNAIKETTPYFDEYISGEAKSRKLSLMSSRKIEEYFGDVYATNYKASFACFAQAQRHRTLTYSIDLLDKPEFYVPTILKSDENLVKEWIKDCNSRAKEFPQGMLVSVNEMGTFDYFVLKMLERKCTHAQLEINESTNNILHNYIKALVDKNHPRAEELKKFSKGARCLSGCFKCTDPCHNIDGINETREI